MCGIFFSIGFENLSPQVIDSVTHRGPDGRGWNEFKSPNGPVIMAHRRLSIIDLSEDGHQPMSSQDGRYWITYNGEIYNYLELRQELESLGYKFQTHTDTEVLLKSFIHWGPDCLNKFNGMFAFVIWDEKEKKAFVARDRFGIKPLYYYRQGNKIAFASEIKQFTYLPGFESKLNHKIAYHVFTSKLIHDGYETLFQGVYQLLGGEFLSLEKNNVRSFASQKWYDIAKVNVNKKTSEEASKSFKKLFFDSVNLRLRSDVSVGSCLSGGIDSSSIVSMLGELSDSKNGIKTFSACYKNDPLDESHYIDIVTKHTGIKNTKVYPDPKNFMNLWEKMVYHHDAPIGGATVFAQNQVFQCANQHKIKVMLDGQGADEVFAGYHSMFGAFHAELFNTLKFLKLISEIKSCKNLHGYNYKALLLRVLETSYPKSLKALVSVFGKKAPISSSFLSDNFFNQYNPTHELPWIQKLSDHGLTVPKNLYELCVQKIKLSLPSLLHCEDRNSMMYGIESRVPFLDYRLVEFGLSLQSHLKISNSVTKKVIRDGMKKILPYQIYDRQDKLGFAVPEIKWFKNSEIREKASRICNEVVNMYPEIFKQGYTLSENRENKNVQFFDQFSIIDFGLFMRKFNVKV